MSVLIHITTQNDWERAVESGEYTVASLETEGFIHCSTEKQVAKVANFFYKAVPNLLLLKMNEEKIVADIKWEGADGDIFPHIYGPINLDAIDEVETFSMGVDGNFTYP